MKCSRFYVIEGLRQRETWHEAGFVKETPVNRGPAPRCGTCGSPLGARRWLPPHRVELELVGKEFGDVVFGPGDTFLVSDRFKDLYCRFDLTGLRGFDPVEIVRIKRESRSRSMPPEYFAVQPTKVSLIDHIRSGFRWKEQREPCAECGIAGRTWTAFDRLVIREDTWLGQDFFSPIGAWNGLMASARVREVHEEQNIRNLVLIPAEEFSSVYFDQERPGRLQ